ncbi:hypothetical protein FB451DRAFT_303593 [Mycena latifolia]|nr:hypothetical protein FB451DRAFT_303593 [Mycena latifolia]
MSSPPPAKRQRQDVEITRSEVWHADGTVVLQAGDTQFRVHGSVLSRHSLFFRDMQELPRPPDQPSVEGCPIIQLSDRAEDVERVLEALYNPLSSSKEALPLPVLACHVRLGRKCGFADILPTIAERLTYENPTSLEEYDALNKENGLYVPTRIMHLPGLYFDTVTLARESNLRSVLPCAYYRVLLSSSPTGIFDGLDRGGGTLATLSPIDQRRCSVGRAAIQKAQWDTGNTLGWIQDAEERDCNDVFACRSEKSSLLRRMVVKGSILALPPVSSLDSLDLCRVCMESAKTKMAAGRQKMWDALPTFFELPPWSELKNEPEEETA